MTLPDRVRAIIAEAHQGGATPWAIANQLNSDRIPPPHGGGEWYASTVASAIRSIDREGEQRLSRYWETVWSHPVWGAVTRAVIGAALFAGAFVVVAIMGTQPSAWDFLVGGMGLAGVLALAFAFGHVLRNEVGRDFSSALGLAVGGLALAYVWFTTGLTDEDPDGAYLVAASAAFTVGIGAVAYLLAHPKYRRNTWRGLLGLGALVGALSAIFTLGS